MSCLRSHLLVLLKQYQEVIWEIILSRLAVAPSVLPWSAASWAGIEYWPNAGFFLLVSTRCPFDTPRTHKKCVLDSPIQSYTTALVLFQLFQTEKFTQNIICVLSPRGHHMSLEKIQGLLLCSMDAVCSKGD